ncbi:MAG: hypothetical protein FD162_2444 [Rhodobacteraceae bacterium]|uniref:DUF6173 family protein n=1 Tax=Cypionkella sp. TaxID=2811411 RepID=UPI001328C4CF|nr:MAG: hypothetical protein FD162_2444 [Paracoccaceae bacterium]
MPNPIKDSVTETAMAQAIAKASGMPHAPLSEPMHPQPPQQKSPAEWAYDRLVLYIRNFEKQLDSNHEIAMGFAGSDAGVLKIEGLGFFEPDMITFYGRDEDGTKTQLIQHIAQLSVMLRAVPKSTPEAPPTRIGFRLASGWSGGESGDGSA